MSQVHDILRKYNIRPVKSLGQNFLTDEKVLDRIVQAAEIDENDIVIEIGAGIGNLTMKLSRKAGKVFAVEIDRLLIPVLQDVLKDFGNVEIINRDIMKVNIKDIISGTEQDGSIKAVANLPYYITTPIIMKLLENESCIDSMILMVQKEVAARITAKPGNKQYGALSVAVNYHSVPEKITDVPPHCFVPPPNVYSTVLKLTVRREKAGKVINEDFFFNVVKAAFGQRRKKLVNALSALKNFKTEKSEIIEVLQDIGIDENARGETLSIVQFAKLSDALFLKNC